MSTEMMVALAVAGVSVIGIWVLSRRVPHVVDDDWAPPDDEDVELADPLDEEMRDAGVMGRIRAKEQLAEQRDPAAGLWNQRPVAQQASDRPSQQPPAPEVNEPVPEPAGYRIDLSAAPPEFVFLAMPTGVSSATPEVLAPAETPTALPPVQPTAMPLVVAESTHPAAAPEPQVVPQPTAERLPVPDPMQVPVFAPAEASAPVLRAPSPAPEPRTSARASPTTPGPRPVRQLDPGPDVTPDSAPAPVPTVVPSAAAVTDPAASVPAPARPAPSLATPTPSAATPTPSVATRPAPVAHSPAPAVQASRLASTPGPVLRFAGVIRGDSSRQSDGRERRYVTLKKKEAVGFPWREGGRVPVDLEVNGRVYSAGVRSTRSQPVVYIAADLRGPTGEGVTLAAVLESAGMQKRQLVTIEVENGTLLRLLPGAVPPAPGGRESSR